MANEQTTEAQNKVALDFIQKEMKSIIELRDGFKAEQLKFVKDLVNKDLSDTELYLFLMFAGKIGLNPFKKEIIAIVYSKDNPSERRVGYIVTRDGKMVVSQGRIKNLKVEAIYIKKTKTPEGQEITITVPPWDGTLWGAKASCIRDGETYEVTVPLAEYDSGRNVWASKKSTMIKKVAQSQLLSMAVPELLGGVYEEEEMADVTIASKSTKTIKSPEKKVEEVAEPAEAVATLPDGEKPATKDMIENLKSMGVTEIPEGLTRQQAAEMIKSTAIGKGAA